MGIAGLEISANNPDGYPFAVLCAVLSTIRAYRRALATRSAFNLFITFVLSAWIRAGLSRQCRASPGG
jgi:hypothetical protein